MSKRSKSENKLRRLSQKKARRLANQAKYEAMKEKGQNSKSKRFLKRTRRVLVRKHNHPQIPCGNPACVRCYPELAI